MLSCDPSSFSAVAGYLCPSVAANSLPIRAPPGKQLRPPQDVALKRISYLEVHMDWQTNLNDPIGNLSQLILSGKYEKHREVVGDSVGRQLRKRMSVIETFNFVKFRRG